MMSCQAKETFKKAIDTVRHGLRMAYRRPIRSSRHADGLCRHAFTLWSEFCVLIRRIRNGMGATVLFSRRVMLRCFCIRCCTCLAVVWKWTI